MILLNFIASAAILISLDNRFILNDCNGRNLVLFNKTCYSSNDDGLNVYIGNNKNYSNSCNNNTVESDECYINVDGLELYINTLNFPNGSKRIKRNSEEIYNYLYRNNMPYIENMTLSIAYICMLISGLLSILVGFGLVYHRNSTKVFDKETTPEQQGLLDDYDDEANDLPPPPPPPPALPAPLVPNRPTSTTSTISTDSFDFRNARYDKSKKSQRPTIDYYNNIRSRLKKFTETASKSDNIKPFKIINPANTSFATMGAPSTSKITESEVIAKLAGGVQNFGTV